MPGVGGIRIGIPSGGGGGGFSPRDISGLVAWFDADSAYITKDGSNRISGWANRITDDAANTNLAQGTAGRQPLWNASDANFNSKPTLTFDKTRTDLLTSGTWTTPMPAISTWFVVARITSHDVSGNILVDGPATNQQAIYATPNNWNLFSSGNVAWNKGSAVTGETVVAGGCFHVTAPNAKLYVNAKTATATGSAGLWTLTQLFVGGSGTGLPQYDHDGQIAEVCGWNRNLSQAEVERFLNWAGAKYNITIGA